MPANSQDIENAISEVERHLQPGPGSEERSGHARETAATRAAFRQGATIAMFAVGAAEGDVKQWVLRGVGKEMAASQPFMDTEWESYMARISDALHEDPQALPEVETACTELYAVLKEKVWRLEAVLQITQKILNTCHAPSTGELDLEATRRLIGGLTSHLKGYEAMRATGLWTRTTKG